jgi:hypothetical protein
MDTIETYSSDVAFSQSVKKPRKLAISNPARRSR